MIDAVNSGVKMPISTGDILGHSQVGVYLSVVGDVLFIPSTLEDEIANEIESSFDMESVSYSHLTLPTIYSV